MTKIGQFLTFYDLVCQNLDYLSPNLRLKYIEIKSHNNDKKLTVFNSFNFIIMT